MIGNALPGSRRTFSDLCLDRAALAASMLVSRLAAVRRKTVAGIACAPGRLVGGDAERARQLYLGRFDLAGTTVDIGGSCPFRIQAPNDAWAMALHGFAWLGDLEAAGGALAKAQARGLIRDWIGLGGKTPKVAWKPAVVARRLVAWLAHAPFFADGATPEFRRMFARSLARHVIRLAEIAHRAEDGVPRLQTATAFALGTFCTTGLERYRTRAADFLAGELNRQILADGGHVSRNPQALVAILSELVPLRDVFLARDIPPVPELLSAIDRMVPMIKMLLHGDGGLAHFNGTGPIETATVAAVLKHCDYGARPTMMARASGYARMEHGGSMVLVDCGRADLVGHAKASHAGCLSFEFSHLKHRLVVNCGACVDGPEEWQEAARFTAAHSTLTIADAPSASPYRRRLLAAARAGGFCGPDTVEASRTTGDEGTLVAARHDGYAGRYGLVHGRELFLAAGGDDLRGVDTLTPVGTGPVADHTFAIRFHLHPAVRASASKDGRSILLLLPDKSGWTFVARHAAVALEESVYFDGGRMPRRTMQIVLTGRAGRIRAVNWAFKKLAGKPRAEPAGDQAVPELPLEGGGLN